MSTKTVAIAGITGKMGRLIAESLLRRPNVQIHGIARNPSKAPAVLTSAPNVKIFEAAADDVSSIRKALKGVDITISCYLGDNKLMVDGQKLLIDASIAENVPRFIAGDWSLDYRSLKLGDLPSKDPMIKVAQYLREKEQYEQIQGVHVLCGVFVEILTSAYGGWMNAAKDEITYFGSGDEEYDMTTMVDAAAFTAQVAMDSGATGYLQGTISDSSWEANTMLTIYQFAATGRARKGWRKHTKTCTMLLRRCNVRGL